MKSMLCAAALVLCFASCAMDKNTEVKPSINIDVSTIKSMLDEVKALRNSEYNFNKYSQYDLNTEVKNLLSSKVEAGISTEATDVQVLARAFGAAFCSEMSSKPQIDAVVDNTYVNIVESAIKHRDYQLTHQFLKKFILAKIGVPEWWQERKTDLLNIFLSLFVPTLEKEANDKSATDASFESLLPAGGRLLFLCNREDKKNCLIQCHAMMGDTAISLIEKGLFKSAEQVLRRYFLVKRQNSEVFLSRLISTVNNDLAKGDNKSLYDLLILLKTYDVKGDYAEIVKTAVSAIKSLHFQCAHSLLQPCLESRNLSIIFEDGEKRNTLLSVLLSVFNGVKKDTLKNDQLERILDLTKMMLYYEPVGTCIKKNDDRIIDMALLALSNLSHKEILCFLQNCFDNKYLDADVFWQNPSWQRRFLLAYINAFNKKQEGEVSKQKYEKLERLLLHKNPADGFNFDYYNPDLQHIKTYDEDNIKSIIGMLTTAIEKRDFEFADPLLDYLVSRECFTVNAKGELDKGHLGNVLMVGRHEPRKIKTWRPLIEKKEYAVLYNNYRHLVNDVKQHQAAINKTNRISATLCVDIMKEILYYVQ